jgi:hypothetical protein
MSSSTLPSPPDTANIPAKFTVTLNGSDWSVAKYGVVEYLRSHRFMRILTGLLGVLCALAAPLWWAGFRPNTHLLHFVVFDAFSPLLLEFFVAIPLLWMATVSGPAFRLVFAPSEASRELKKAEEKFDESNKPEDAVQLDFTRLNAYYEINQNQARSSFRWALFSIFLGFATIVTGIWLFYFRIATPDKFMASLSTASGIVVSLISGLFLNMYAKTQDRSLYFYQQLSRLQRVALAIRLVGEHQDAEQQTEARNRVIQQLLLESRPEFLSSEIMNKQPIG